MPSDAVLFDLDNTLYPYPPCNRAGKQRGLEVARERGFDLDREGFEALYQAGRVETKRDTATTAASHRRMLYFKHGLREQFGTAAPHDVVAITDGYWSGYLEAMEPFDDLQATLDALADADVAVGITTNHSIEIQYRKLRGLGIGDRIDALVTSEEAGREKPGSVMFTLPLARLNCRPEEAVLVGDDPESDIAGANAVGLETVLYNGEVAPDAPDVHRPDHEVDSLDDVLEVVL